MSNFDKQNRESQPPQKLQQASIASLPLRPQTVKQVEKNPGSSTNSQSDTSQKIESKKAPLSSRNSTQTKQYRYWIDVQDILNMVRFTEHQITLEGNDQEESKEDWFRVSDKHKRGRSDSSSNYSNQQQQQTSSQDAQADLTIQQVAENDRETKEALMNVLSLAQNNSLEDILQLHRGLKKSYLIENQKVITQVYQNNLRSEIAIQLEGILAKLLTYQNKFKNKTLRLCYSTQQELYSIFLKIFGVEVFTNITARKIFYEIWESSSLFRETTNIMPSILLNLNFYLKIELFIRGRALFSQGKREFPLHKAVFENNLPLISRLIKCTHEGIFYQEKNEIDVAGNTPLIFAVKLGYVDAIKVLCDLFTCPKLKSFNDCTENLDRVTSFMLDPCALDVASAIKNKESIKILLEANQKIKQHYLDLHKEAIFRALESLPDFKIDMHFNCKSNFIPFVKNITPSDTYKIYKQGSKIRLDMTLIGFRNLKCIRGNLSVIFKGRHQDNEGDLYIVDHETKSVQNIFNDIGYAKIEKDLEEIMSDQQYQKLYKADKFKMEPVIDKRGDIRSKLLEGFRAEKYMLKTQFTMTKFKINLQEVKSLQKYKSFEDYLANNQFDIASCPQSVVDKLIAEQHPVMGKESSNSLVIAHTSYGTGANPFNATTPNPHYIRMETDHDIASSSAANQLLTLSNKDCMQNNTIIGYQTNKKTTKKTINASIWLSKQHPLSLDSFLPLLQVLSFSSKQIAKFKDYLMKYQLPKGSFPLKAKVPLFMTMKASFSLQNLQFDTSDFAPNLFTVDEEYMKIKAKSSLGGQILNPNSKVFQWMNQNQPSPNQAAQTLKEIYKLCKTDEDYEEDEEDSESLERANELFNSMLKKVNKSEELLLEMSSFHSEYDSVDLSERHLNDESFKLGNHAFSKIQTMNQINVRHEDEILPLYGGKLMPSQKQIQEYQSLSKQQRRLKYGRRTSNNNQASQKYLMHNQTNEGENIFDSKILEERPIVNSTYTKRSFTKNQKPPTNGPPLHSQSAQEGDPNASDTVKTLKKNFQPRNLKNYKNMIKYGCNQSQFEGTYNYSAVPKMPDPQGNTPPISTADTSLLTNKLSSFFTTQNHLAKKDQNAWFKQILSYKNNLVSGGGGGNYLQTIESEEVLGTEGANEGALSQIGNQTVAVNSSILITQSNFDDAFSRKSFIQSFNAASQNNQLNSSRESSLKSYNSGGVPPLQHQQQQQSAQHLQKGFNQSFPQQDQQHFIDSKSLLIKNPVLNASQQQQNPSQQQIMKEERKALMNHNTLISRFHNQVNKQQYNQHQMQGVISTSSMNPIMQLPPHQTPQKIRDPLSQSSQALTPQQLNFNLSKSQATNKQTGSGPPPIDPQIINSAAGSKQTRPNSNNAKSLLPPKVAHRRQSSYGGSSSNVASYLGNIQQQTTQNNQTGSGGIFNKFFGSTFNRTSAAGPQNQGPVIQNSRASEVNPFTTVQLQQQNSTIELGRSSHQQKQQHYIQGDLIASAFQTFDHPKQQQQQTTSRTTSNTQYGQHPPPSLLGFAQNKQQTNSAIFVKGLLSHTNKKTNDVDIFLPYQV